MSGPSYGVLFEDVWLKKILESYPGRSPNWGLADLVAKYGSGAFVIPLEIPESVLWWRVLTRARSRFRMENSSFNLTL
jgi:hypothetical protein